MIEQGVYGGGEGLVLLVKCVINAMMSIYKDKKENERCIVLKRKASKQTQARRSKAKQHKKKRQDSEKYHNGHNITLNLNIFPIIAILTVIFIKYTICCTNKAYIKFRNLGENIQKWYNSPNIWQMWLENYSGWVCFSWLFCKEAPTGCFTFFISVDNSAVVCCVHTCNTCKLHIVIQSCIISQHYWHEISIPSRLLPVLSCKFTDHLFLL